jgi:hypothetical protein
VLTKRVLNRTLLHRQHLLERVDLAPLAMVEHLLGLQAQDVLPPYLSLAARIRDFDPLTLSATLESRETTRILLMRGTIHLVSAQDALTLRPFIQPLLTKQCKNADWGNNFPQERYDEVVKLTYATLADGPLAAKALGEALAKVFTDRSPSDATNLAKALAPLVQIPPRGLWKRSGGQTYVTVEEWLGTELPDPDVAEIVRRYLRAFGPATAADVTAWSGATGMAPVFKALGDELVTLEVQGKKVFDLAGLELADEETPAPVRLLGKYDNVWLSHAGRDRVTTPERRKRWMGLNGGMAETVFVDGMLEGLWRRTGSGALDVELYRPLTRAERHELDAEVAAVERLLAGSGH